MSDWDLGDFALCIGRQGWALAATGEDADGPRAGGIYEVRRLVVTADGSLYLGFAEWPRAAFHHSGFVKVTPDADFIADERKAGVPV